MGLGLTFVDGDAFAAADANAIVAGIDTNSNEIININTRINNFNIEDIKRTLNNHTSILGETTTSAGGLQKKVSDNKIQIDEHDNILSDHTNNISNNSNAITTINNNI